MTTTFVERLRTVSRRPWLLASGVYAVLAIVVTWPLSRVLGSHLPLGRLSAATVPYFNLWTLEWNADRLLHGLVGYFDAPIFAPAHNAFALSEPQGATGLVFAPLSWWLGGVAAYNAVFLLVLCTNGLAMRHCVRVAGGGGAAATCCGAFTVALPFVLEESGVLQLTVIAPSLLVLGEVIGMYRAPHAARLPRAAAWLALVVWTCEYYALLLGLLVAPATIALLLDGRVRKVLTPRALLLAAFILGVACTPLVLAQHSALRAHTRSAATIHSGSATAASYVRPPPGSMAARAVPVLAAKGDARSLYPGLVLLVCAALGLRAGLRSERRRLATAIALGAALALLVSFGTRLSLGDASPYALTIQRFVPGFAQLRSPYRITVFVQLGLVLLASFAFDVMPLERRIAGRRVPLAVILASIVVLGLLETVPLERSLHRFPDAALREPWIRWLARQPSGRVVMLPPARSSEMAAFEPTALAMLQALRHRQPLVNGYSGFFPPVYRSLVQRLREFPEPRALQSLRFFHVRYVVAEDAWLAARATASGRQVGLPKLFGAAGRTVYDARLAAAGRAE